MTLPKPSLPHVLNPPHIEGGVKGVIMQALTIVLLTRHNDIPDTESPAPKSPVCESVTASGADTVSTHAASAVCRHHHDADQMRTAAFAQLTCANAPLSPPRKHNYMAECARFLPLRMRQLLCQTRIIQTSLGAILFGAFAQPKLAGKYTIACAMSPQGKVRDTLHICKVPASKPAAPFPHKSCSL